MNKIERMVLLPLTLAAACAGVVEGIIICNKLARVKVADAAIRELDREDLFETEDDAESEA